MATIPELLEHQKFNALSQEQVDSFMKHGFVRLPGAISQEVCDSYTRDVWARLGMDPNDKATWTALRTNMPRHRMTQVKELAPVAWEAICELCGGEDRVADGGRVWSDGFIVNLGSPETEGTNLTPQELDNWHVDGDFFVHFLDSPEQALLVIPCWSDVEENGGATWICTEGPQRIGKWLYDHPEGVAPDMSPRDAKDLTDFKHEFYDKHINEAPQESFFEMTGKRGDVILLHPLMLHSASKNGRRLARIITNPPVAIKEPFEFNRENPKEYSLVELKTMQDLGGPEKFRDWKITRERQSIVPARVMRQQKLLEEENERLRKLGRQTADTLLDQSPHVTQYAQQAKAGA